MPEIDHVFVLMLENRSFDHMFALSGIPGIHAATAADINQYDGKDYPFQGGAPDILPSDPLHDFCDVLDQVCGAGSDCSAVTPYPPRTNSGFVANYATTKVKRGLLGSKPLPAADRGLVMRGIDSARQAPALDTLARAYALCDGWYASLPGPTWPNRFFVHGASSDGEADAPSAGDIFKWESFSGFRYPHGSIYDRLRDAGYAYRLYGDKRGPLSGRIPQVAAIKGIDYFDVRDLDDFAGDLAGPYTARYTFIEPAYGDIVSGSYRGGSSQHPMDGLAGGDDLVARVYNAIRQSPLWENSLLIITYDEHGGFYDSGIPPQAAPPPNDGSGAPQNPQGFDFSVYGVRVPAVVVSPWIARGGVDHSLYDHSSVLATVERLFGLDPLTDRDAQAADVLHLLTGTLRGDADCPQALPERGPAPLAMPELAALDGARSDEPIADDPNLQAFLFVVRKADRETRGDMVAMSRFQPLRTRADARQYLDEVMPRLEAAREGGRIA